MHTLNAQQKRDIINIMFELIASYINDYCTDSNDGDDVAMYCEDVQYNTAALHKFIENSNVEQLCNSIMQQDTLVREHFANVLFYVESNELITDYFKALF